MSKRGRSPALYEKIRSHMGTAAPAVEPMELPTPLSPPPASPASPGLHRPMPSALGGGMPSALGGGRIVRVPIGYAWLAGAGVAMIVILTYVMGYSRGEQAGRSSLDSAMAERLQADELLRGTTDPLNAPAGQGGEARPPTSAARGQPAGEPKASGASGGGGGGGGAGDPRQPGLNYFTLMHAKKAGAERFIDFCRERGLDAHAVPVNNGRSFQVIVLPGHAGSERSSEAVKRLEQQITRVSSQWRERTREVLRPYPAKYAGP